LEKYWEVEVMGEAQRLEHGVPPPWMKASAQAKMS
jgi:hypothetical protein